jgi:ribosome-associated heat shock protein Hsp15
VAVRTPGGEYTVVVRGLNAQRRPAAEAQGLYEETAESLRLREEAAELGRAQAAARERGAGRPTKRDRRQIGRFTGED